MSSALLLLISALRLLSLWSSNLCASDPLGRPGTAQAAGPHPQSLGWQVWSGVWELNLPNECLGDADPGARVTQPCILRTAQLSSFQKLGVEAVEFIFNTFRLGDQFNP